ncbi:DUF1007 family protein [Rhizobiales bacterium TNE-4]|nr:DUF1007 family protein [Rhizobiales bacterium TNE-4]MBV1828723.1 DUF1007 family protein [Rhizobiales bacterium TNE-4]
MRQVFSLGCLLGVVLFWLGLAAPVQAHPHVWITAQAEILYNPDGSVAAIRHVWDFDEAYTAFATQGLDTNKDGKFSRDELKALAQENAESLHEFDFFTSLKIDGKRPAFGQPKDYFMEMNGQLLRFVYVLPLEKPVKAKTSLSLEIADKSFFVAFNLTEGEGAVTLVGAPQGCTVRINRPKTQVPQQTLSEQAFQALGGEDVGLQFATRAIVACP